MDTGILLGIIGIVISVLALGLGLMALPTVFQMFWGRPKLTFEADEFMGTEAKILVIAIKNQPIKSRFLRKLHVEREIGNVLAFVDIQEHGTGKFLVRALPGLLNCAPTREQGLLTRALPGFTVGLTVIATKDGKATIVSGHTEKLLPIGPGEYVAFATIVRGDEDYKLMQSFRIGKLDHETIWYQRNVISIP
jgi:hypothetical protein